MKTPFGHVALSAVIAVFSLAQIGCGDSNVEKVDPGKAASGTVANGGASSPHGQAAVSATSAAGVRWTVPSAWKLGEERPMRIASYLIGDGAEQADCAVFYFGPGQGGAVQANIDRWVGQFTQPDGSESTKAAKTDNHTIAGLKVTTIDLSGTYMSSMGGPMSGGKTEEKPGYRMLGAIVEAPEGPVFFKLTGPSTTVVKSLDNFQQLVESVKKQ